MLNNTKWNINATEFIPQRTEYQSNMPIVQQQIPLVLHHPSTMSSQFMPILFNPKDLNTFKTKEEVDQYFIDFNKELRDVANRTQIHYCIYKKFSTNPELALYILNKYFALLYVGYKPFSAPKFIKLTDKEQLVKVENRMFGIDKGKNENGETIVEKHLTDEVIFRVSMQHCGFLNEVFAYSQFENNEKHIIKFHGYDFNEKKGVPRMFLEFAGGNLREFSRNKKLPIFTQLRILEQIITGLMVLHDKYNIAHIDIKPYNLAVHQEHDGTYTIKFLDFGSAIFFSKGSKIEKKLAITLEYASPESLVLLQSHLRVGNITKEHDIYCVARTIQAVALNTSNYAPGCKFDNFSTALTYINDHADNLVPKFNPQNAPQYKKMIDQMLNIDVTKRASLMEVKNTLPKCFEECERLPENERTSTYRF